MVLWGKIVARLIMFVFAIDDDTVLYIERRVHEENGKFIPGHISFKFDRQKNMS